MGVGFRICYTPVLIDKIDVKWENKGLLHGYEWRLRFGALELRFG